MATAFATGVQVSAATPRSATAVADAQQPSIDRPRLDAVYSPGPVTFGGRTQPDSQITLYDAASGAVLGAAEAAANGDWQTTITLPDPGEYTVVAESTTPDDQVRESRPVTITIAPAVAPDTGAPLIVSDPDATGRTFTVLLALLLLAGGFSVVLAGRLLLMLAHDRREQS